MRWDFGQVFKEIRKSKGLSQKEVCGDFLSRATLSKIENNKLSPSVDNMDYLLHQLGLNFAEFEYICHAYAPSRHSEIIHLFENSPSFISISHFEKIIELCYSYLEDYQDKTIDWILQYCRACVSIRQNGDSEISKKLVNNIWEYLQKGETWYSLDLRLFNAVVLLFPFEYLPKIVDRLLTSLQKYKDFKDIRTSQFSILMNVGTIFLHHGDMEMCLKLTQEAHKVAQQTLRVDHLGPTSIRLGICKQDRDMISKGLQLLELSQQTQVLNNLKREVEEFAGNLILK